MQVVRAWSVGFLKLGVGGESWRSDVVTRAQAGPEEGLYKVR